MNINKINEANAGIINSPQFKQTLDKLVKVFKNIVDGLPENKKLSSIHDSFLTDSIKINFYNKNTKTDAFSFLPKSVEFSINLMPIIEHDKKEVWQGAHYKREDEFFDITIKIHPNATKTDILKIFGNFKLDVAHELSHFYIDHRGRYQFGLDDFKKDNEIDWVSYFSDKSEVEARVVEINVELEKIHKDQPKLKFSSALKKSKTYKDILNAIKSNKSISDKVKKYILKKTIYYWTNVLNGKF